MASSRTQDTGADPETAAKTSVRMRLGRIRMNACPQSIALAEHNGDAALPHAPLSSPASSSPAEHSISAIELSEAPTESSLVILTRCLIRCLPCLRLLCPQTPVSSESHTHAHSRFETPMMVLCLVSIPLACTLGMCVLPYDSIPQMWFIGMLIAGMSTVPLHASMMHVGVFYPRLLLKSTCFRTTTSVLSFMAALLGSVLTFLPYFAMYPLNTAVICGVYLMTMSTGPWLANSFLHRQVLTHATAKAGPDTENEQTATAAQSDKPWTPLFFAAYYGFGPTALPVLVGYLCLFSYATTAAAQTFANVALHTVIVFQKEALLGFATQRMSNLDASCR